MSSPTSPTCGPENAESTPEPPERLQLHLVLPYKFQPREDARVLSWLRRGYRIARFQRITDREAVVTLERVTPPDPASSPPG